MNILLIKNEGGEYLLEVIQNDKQLLRDEWFNDFFDNDGNFAKDRLGMYLKEQTEGISKLTFKQLTAYIPLFTFFLLVLIRVITSLTDNSNNIYVDIAICMSCILLLIALVTIPLMYTSVSIQKKYNACIHDVIKEFWKRFDSILISECEMCVQVKSPELLNVYNLYTYKQIQQIERSLVGPNAEVYCYSRYRDDGGIGPAETDEIVVQNLTKKGIPYHFFYYENSPRDTELFEPRNNREIYIALSDSNQLKKDDAYKQCLDYRIYRNARFDIMIYKQDDNILEGYFCLNFPVDANVCEGCKKDYSKYCPLKSTNGSTDKLLYKKMPRDITSELYRKLMMFEKISDKKGI